MVQKSLLNSDGITPNRAPNASREVSGSNVLTPKICVHPPRWFASTAVHWRRNTRGVVNNVGGSQSLLITLMAHLTSTTLVFVEVCLSQVQLTSALHLGLRDTDRRTCLCDSFVPSATMRVQNYAGSRIKMAVAESAPQADKRSVCVIRTTVGQHFN